MTRTYIKDLKEKIGEEVTIKAWVDIRRDQGKLIFFDFRDASGYVQGVILPNAKEAHAIGEKLRPEWVVEVHGKVNKRPEKNIQADKQNGDIELEILGITVLNEAITPAFDIHTEGLEVGEEQRLKYRYLDLRRQRLQRNIRMRHKVIKFMRDYLDKENFIEIETPVIGKANVETGARNYVVPSRLDKGAFYGLPQSPQQYKQLLMVAGMERYFQVAKCFRDEDTRGDRQPEFTQLDLEMSYVEREDVMALTEGLLIALVETLYPEKKIQQKPFPRLTYKEAMEKHNSDKPDLREDKNDPNLLAFEWVVDFPFFEKKDEGGWTFTHNPFSRAMPEHEESLAKKENIESILTSQYDIVLNGVEVGGGSIRNHKPDMLKKVLEIIGMNEEHIQGSFGHMLDALAHGAPPHGGIAPGIDRIMMILHNEPNIRETIAFPKTGEGRDPMMDSPSSISAKQLKELGIKIVE
jgi:aspartyl-tRNA synthetase